VRGQDPREYAPLLEQLAAKQDRECCFEIDLMLKRYDKAVMHAVRGGEGMWDKARAVMEEHGLYLVAVHNLRRMPTRGAHLKEALQLYAAHVSERGEHRLAGLVYQTASLPALAATELQQDAASWEGALLLLHEQGELSEVELQGRCYGMAEALRVGGDCRSAARVYLSTRLSLPSPRAASGWRRLGLLAEPSARISCPPLWCRVWRRRRVLLLRILMRASNG
jgi:hypothetical protein